MKFNDNNTVSYAITRSYKFDLEKSFGDIHAHQLITTNMVLLGASTMASRKSSVAALGMSTLAKTLDSKAIINMTVYEYLYGYEDPILTLGSNIVPSIVPFGKFGFLDQFIKIEENHMVTTTLEDVYEEEAQAVEEVSSTPTIDDSELDVEYDDDVIGNSNAFHTNSDDKLHQVENKMSIAKPTKLLKLRDHSIELWNGSPLMPSWESHGVNNEDKY